MMLKMSERSDTELESIEKLQLQRKKLTIIGHERLCGDKMSQKRQSKILRISIYLGGCCGKYRCFQN